MQQVIKFKSSKEHYKADACVVWCFDDRFSDLFEETKKKLNLKRIDQVEIAGGAKDLNGESAGFVLSQIFKSIKLHHTPLIILMVHKDCGAYGKLDVSDENKFFSDELNVAKVKVEEFLKNNQLYAVVKTYFVDFEGLSEV